MTDNGNVGEVDIEKENVNITPNMIEGNDESLRKSNVLSDNDNDQSSRKSEKISKKRVINMRIGIKRKENEEIN